MPEAYIVDAVRSPVGRRGGGLAGVHPADLGAHSIRALMDHVDVDPAAVDDVMFGCVDTIGPQAGDIARTCWLVAGLPDEVPGTTVDRQCGSSQQAVHFAAQAVMSGTTDLVVAGGVQNMSAIPISAAMLVGEQYGFETPVRRLTRLGGALRHPGGVAVPRRGDDRREVGHLARGHGGVRGRSRTGAPCAPATKVASTARSCRSPASPSTKARASPTSSKIRSLRTLVEGGRLTAAVSSQISDASAAMLIASEAAVRTHGLKPRGSHPPPLGARRRPGLDAHRADPGDRVRAREDGHDGSTTSTSSRSTRRSRQWCSRGRRNPAPTSPR